MPFNNFSASDKIRRVLIILRKIIVRTVLALLLLFLLVIGLIQFPGIQNYIKNKIVTSLSDKLKTKVELGYVRINFGGSLILENLFLADRQQDTVISAGKLKVAVNPLQLFRKKVILTNISLSDIVFNYIILDSLGKTNLDFIINSFAGNKKEEKKTSSSWEIQVKKVQLLTSSVQYHNLADSMSFGIKIGKLLVNISESNLEYKKFDVDRILLQNSNARLISYQRIIVPKVSVVNEKVAQDRDSSSLSISLKKMDFENVSFQNMDSLSGSGGSYQVAEAHIEPKTIDLNKRNIEISSLSIRKGKVNYTASAHKTDIVSTSEKGATTNENWQIRLEDGNFQFDELKLKNLVETGEGSLNYLADISLSNLIMDVSASLHADRSWMFNLASLRFEDNRTSKLISLTTGGNFDGKSIKINPLRLRLGLSYIIASGSGTLSETKKGAIPDFNAAITSSDFYLDDLAPYLPKIINKNLQRIPSQMSLTLNATSLNQVLKGKGDLKTEQGDVSFTGELTNKSDAPAYNVAIDLMNFNVAFFAQNPQLGRVSTKIKASGMGFMPESMMSDLDMLISYASFKGYTYRDIYLNGNINKGLLKAKLVSDDPMANLTMNIHGKVGDRSVLTLNSHINNLDLNAIGMIKEQIAISALIDASYAGEGKTKFEAHTDTLQVRVRTPNSDIKTSTNLQYIVSGDNVLARIKSNFGNIAYNGNVPLQDVPVVLKKYFDQYFSHEKADSAKLSTKFFTVAVDIKDLSLMNDLMALNISIPEEAHFVAILKKNRLTSNLDLKKLIFKDMEINDLVLDASGKDSSFHVDFKTAALHNKVHTIKDISLQSDLRQGDLDSRLSFSNAASQKWFNIGATMQPLNPQYNVVIREPLMLNHQLWNVDSRNRTYFENKNIVFSNLKVTNGEKEISLLSDDRQPEKVALSFKNLQLVLLSEILRGDTTFISGKINGDLMAMNLFTKPLPVFEAKLDVNDIIVEKRALGALNIIASNVKNNDIADLNIKFGKENMLLTLNGEYGLKKDLPMNLDLKAQNFSLQAIQPLIEKVITSASGFLNASINVKGNFSNPEVNGEIGFDKASAYIEAIQAKFAIDKQKIIFSGDGIDFNKFTIKDADGSNMVINGKVALINLKQLSYDLQIKSDKFLAYQGPPDNLPGQDNKIILTSEINITGENNNPNIDANVFRIDEGSRFYYKITKRASTLTEDGVIVFLGTEDTIKEILPANSIMENLNLTANISLAENTEVTIITDPVRNFGLNMKGGGAFSLAQRPYQSPRLNGRLDISGGDYTISLSGIKRKFQIADSSSIVWYGNISKPELNLRAYYQVRTSPAELLGETETTGTLPFMVNMNISGTLEDPQLNFRLSLPREYEGIINGDVIASKLQEINSNESELNQKAMTLILFGSFGFSNIAGLISNGGGTNVIISNALNQLASQKLKFVDLHFDLQSFDDYGGESQDNLRTEMKVAASKKFINDRLNVQLGATVVLQADEVEQQKSWTERISPEFNIDYLINKPKTLSVRTFRRSEYRGLVEGKIISTGAGIMFQKDFDKLSELFGKKLDESEPVAENQKELDEKK